MIKRKQRIPSSAFKEIFKKAKKKENEYFKIFYLENDLEFYRFAVIVPLEFFLKSVIRNKIKRQIQFILKDWERRHSSFKNNLDLIVLVKKPVNSNFQSLKNFILPLLESLN